MKDSTWLIDCYTAQFRTAEVGENRTNAINSRNFYAAKVTQLGAQIATKNQALGVAMAALAALQAQLDQCIGQCAANNRCSQLQTLIGLWNDVLTAFACDEVPPLDQDECDNAQTHSTPTRPSTTGPAGAAAARVAERVHAGEGAGTSRCQRGSTVIGRAGDQGAGAEADRRGTSHARGAHKRAPGLQCCEKHEGIL